MTAIPGGMASRPNAEKLELIAGWGEEATGSLEQVIAILKPKLDELAALREAAHLPYHSLALSNNGTVDLLEGEWVVVDPEGNEERRFQGPDYGDNLIEHVMPGSYMKSVQLKGPEPKHFFVGPLARLNVNSKMSTPKAQAALDAFRAGGKPRLSAVDFIEARLIDMLNCAERMAVIAGSELGDGPIRVEVPDGHGRALCRGHRGAARHPGPRLPHRRRRSDLRGQPHRRHPEQLRRHRLRGRGPWPGTTCPKTTTSNCSTASSSPCAASIPVSPARPTRPVGCR